MSEAVERTVRIANRRGLHARASAKFVTMAAGIAPPTSVEVEKDGTAVTATSIMGLMMLGAAMGDHVTIRARGPEAADALARLCALVEDKFGED